MDQMNFSDGNIPEMEALLGNRIQVGKRDKPGSSAGADCASPKRKIKKSARRTGGCQPKTNKKRKSRFAKKSCGAKKQAPRRKQKKACPKACKDIL